MAEIKLTLEVLNGPLDGYVIILEGEAIWGTSGEGPLVFPWDNELGERQARFFYEEGHWRAEGFPARHGTYRINRDQLERIEAKTQLQAGDVLKASETWLLVL